MFQYRCQFQPADFQTVPPPPPHGERPFRVLFAGRVERNKGVFDLLEIAATFQRESPGLLQIEICGGGEALAELNRTIAERGLAEHVLIHGKLKRPELLAVYGRASGHRPHAQHLLRRDADGGGGSHPRRPPGPHQPALQRARRIRRALVEAQPDDPASYVAGLRRLMTDRT